jgi:hypothetical protein
MSDELKALRKELDETRVELEGTRLDEYGLKQRVAYLEARVGELHNTIGELRAENTDLDDRRARWAEEHEKRRDELARSEASRQAWAEEAMRLQLEADDADHVPYWEFPHEWTDGGGGDPWNRIRSHCGACGNAYDDDIHDEPFGPPPVLPGPNAPCACLAEGVTLPAGWARPQCAAHPEAREESEEGSGREDTGQACREDIAAKTLGRGLTTSGAPGPGDVTATPAPLSSRDSSVHPEGEIRARPWTEGDASAFEAEVRAAESGDA